MRSPKQTAKLAMLLLLAFLLLCNGVGDVHGKTIHENSVDLRALLDFKQGITDPQGALRSWNTTTHFCRWNGINCTTTRPFRVSSLNLTGQNLQGQITPSIGNLAFLTSLDISYNSFVGTFPALNNLQLQYLLMSNNNLTGINPNAFSNSSNLSYLDLSYNQLEGSIPDVIGQLPKLQTLLLGVNRLSGEFPHAILNISASLQILGLEMNMLEKALPPNIGDLLPSLTELSLDGNSFDGAIPASLGNALGLQHIDLSSNYFTGKIPTSFGKLSNLTFLNLELNFLEARDNRDWGFLNALGNCRSLKVLSLDGNDLQGSIPQSIGNLSPGLQYLLLAGNNLSGQVPQSIGKLSALTKLTLQVNDLSGTIDGWVGKLKSLRQLSLNSNRFTGPIPSSIGNLTYLTYLYMYENEFVGVIPTSLGNLPLLELDLSSNDLVGQIPPNFRNLNDLTLLNLSHNNLQGGILQISNLKHLSTLDLSSNKLAWQIPDSLGQCYGIVTLQMDQNFLTGNIPVTFGNLSSLGMLNLSHNNLSGTIPSTLNKLQSLDNLDLSYNHLQGKIPRNGVFENATAVSLEGNWGLCGGAMDLHMASCTTVSKKAQRQYSLIQVLIPIFGFMSLILLVYILLLVKKMRRRTDDKSPSLGMNFLKVSYADLAQATTNFSESNLVGKGGYGFVYRGKLKESKALQFVKTDLSTDVIPVDHSLFSRSSSRESKAHHDPNNLPYKLIKKITNDFDKDRILGSGGFGTVYKGVHENQEEMAIKVLHSFTGIDDKEFRREFENLKRLNHQNVVKLVGFCSEEEEKLVEFHGKKVTAMHIHLALCFEYVHNGSLEKYISDENEGFDWHTRYKIINGICEGLKYLHEKLIMHCDLKPGNILLDKYNRPKIADFGLSKLIGEGNTKKTMSSIGTCGYRPPEFIDHQIISREFDIYSLGVIIVKIMTGHEGYTNGVGTVTPNSVNLVHESWMKRLRETTNQQLYSSQVKRCIGIAIDCLKSNRCERPTIGEIVSRLNKQYGASTHPSRIATITINSGPSSEGHSEATMDTHTEDLWDVAPQYGSYLDRYISDISYGFDWQTRYSIIKSICEHLKYLHDGLKTPIIHTNLKTSNILLDENMIPGLDDFGMPRLTGEENGTKKTNMMGTIEHMPPEFIEKQVISKEFDIYSLGIIIIKVITGDPLYSKLFDMSSIEFVELAHEEWRERIQRSVNAVSVEGYCQQVKKCLEIAFKCVERTRSKRPSIGDITHMLNRTETMTPPEQIDLHSKDPELPTEACHPLEVLIDVQPQDLCFQFMSSLKLPRKKVISCLLHLNNRGNDRVAFMLVANNFKKFLTKKPICGVVPQRSTYTLNLVMPKKPQSSHEDNFFTLYSVAVGGYDLRNVDKGSVANEYEKYFKIARKTAGQEVQEVMVKVLCCLEADDQGTSSSEPTPPIVEIVTTPDAQQVSSMDVHPEEHWIITANHVGSLRVWDYQTMTPFNSFQLVRYEPVHTAKFIARTKWLVAGDRSGGIHVYNYDQNQHVDSVDAHDSRITTLAVHPTHPFILSSSSEDDDHLIKLWDWSNGWKCTRRFRGHTERVTQVVFSPEDADSFTSASWDGTVKIWSICSDDPNNVITLELDGHAVESLLCVDYFARHDRQHLIVGCKNRTAQIWNLDMKGCVDKLEGHTDRVTVVNLHPKIPILVTGSHDGSVCIWDSTTYKLEKTIAFNLGAVYAVGCVKGSKRIVVGCEQGMATMEI